MLEALKKKMHDAKAMKPDLEIKIEGAHEPEENDEEHNADDVAGPAPHLNHELEVSDGDADKNSSEDPDHEDESMLGQNKESDHEMSDGSEHHMKMLSALADHKSNGASHKLSGLAADKAKEKMASIMKNKMKGRA